MNLSTYSCNFNKNKTTCYVIFTLKRYLNKIRNRPTVRNHHLLLIILLDLGVSFLNFEENSFNMYIYFKFFSSCIKLNLT